MSLVEKVVIVSGGSSGIGRAVVSILLEHGAKVAFTYNTTSKSVSEIMKEANKYKAQAKAYKVNITDQDEVKKMVVDVIKHWGTIDVIINNAGIKKDKTLAFMTADEFKEVIDVNLLGAFHLTQAGIFYMLKNRKGRIINISSISGISGIAGQVNYSSSKSGLIGFTRALAKEVAPYGISVNAIAPGGVDTNMVKGMSKKEQEQILLGVPMGRMCTPREVAQLVLFLSDDDICPSYLTGAVIPLDGGLGS